MIRVKVELWMWLGKELGGDFQSISEMRSLAELDVGDGTTVQKLFENLARRHPVIAQKIFNPQTRKFYPNLTVIVTGKDEVVSPHGGESSVIKDEDRIKVLPMYVGG